MSIKDPKQEARPRPHSVNSQIANSQTTEAAPQIGLKRRDLLLRSGSLLAASAIGAGALGRLALAGEAAAASTAALSGSAFAASMDGLVAAAKKEGQLNVIALPRDWCGYGGTIDGFKAKYGLTVNELHPNAGSGDELKAITAANQRGPNIAPDVIDIGLSFGPLAKKEGLLQPYKVSSWTTIPDAAKDADGCWYGGYYGVLAFEINADIVRKAPMDWSDLLAPEYKNSVALAGHPQASNLAIQGVFAAGLAAANGSIDDASDQGLRLFAELNRMGNLVPVVGGSDSVARGDTPVLITWDYLALGDRDRFKGNRNIEVVVPKTGAVAGLYAQAMSAFAPHPNAARLWMEYLHSDETQLAWLNGYCRPIRFNDLMDGKKVPDSLLDRLPWVHKDGTYHDPVFPSVEEQERARETIINGWDDIVGVKIECQPDAPSAVPMSLNETFSRVSTTG